MTGDSSWAALVLAHSNPEHVRRLIAALSGVSVVLHCDVKTPRPVYERMVEDLPPTVVLADRLNTELATWSLVQAELSCLQVALTQTTAEHFAVLSGADFPVAGPEAIERVLAQLGSRSWIANRPIPFDGWNAPGFSDGGMWRLRHYFPTRHGKIIWVAGRPLFFPIRRSIPVDLVPRMSGQWKIYSRRDAERMLEVLDSRPDLVEFGRHTFTPEETFVASLLASDRIFGADALQPCLTNPWFVNWPPRKVTHPSYFALSDLPRFESMARGATPPTANPGDPATSAPLFARKFDTDSAELVAKIQDLWL